MQSDYKRTQNDHKKKHKRHNTLKTTNIFVPWAPGVIICSRWYRISSAVISKKPADTLSVHCVFVTIWPCHSVCWSSTSSTESDLHCTAALSELPKQRALCGHPIPPHPTHMHTIPGSVIMAVYVSNLISILYFRSIDVRIGNRLTLIQLTHDALTYELRARQQTTALMCAFIRFSLVSFSSKTHCSAFMLLAQRDTESLQSCRGWRRGTLWLV